MCQTEDTETVAMPDMPDMPDMVASSMECLLFRCCGQLLGCATSQAAKVIRPPRLVPLPCASDVVTGLFNYRGRIIGAIDIRPLLGMDLPATQAWQWLVVLKGKQFLTGLLVDEVIGIETIPEAALVNAVADRPLFLPKTFTIDGHSASLLAVDALLVHPAILVNQ